MKIGHGKIHEKKTSGILLIRVRMLSNINVSIVVHLVISLNNKQTICILCGESINNTKYN